jgi:hypothetical protein
MVDGHAFGRDFGSGPRLQIDAFERRRRVLRRPLHCVVGGVLSLAESITFPASS